MKIIKRNGKEVEFDASKISAAIQAANNEVVETDRLSEEDIDNMTNNVKYRCEKMGRALSVEEIQNLVEDEIMKLNAFEIARKYITYRYKRALVRKANTTVGFLLEFSCFTSSLSHSIKLKICSSVVFALRTKALL